MGSVFQRLGAEGCALSHALSHDSIYKRRQEERSAKPTVWTQTPELSEKDQRAVAILAVALERRVWNQAE